jgi:hypothetical protein
MKYKKQIREMDRRQTLANTYGYVDEDFDPRNVNLVKENKRPIKNLKKAWESHEEDWEERDEFFGK